MALKSGWQVKEELPLFAAVLIMVSLALYYWNPSMELGPIFGTAFFVAAIVTAVEVLVTSK